MAANPRFDKALERMREIHETKNRDYCPEGSPYSNFTEAAAVADVDVHTVILALVGLKLARIRQLRALAKRGECPSYESLRDSILDLAVYSTLLLSLEEIP